MKIKMTVKEYFEELKLMEEQYGQEEELYPWIYMLLQMTENSKDVSIRDVHNWKKKQAPKSIKEPKKTILNVLSEKKGPPEILIFDKKTTNFLGCVEIKTFKDRNGNYQSLQVKEENVILSREMSTSYIYKSYFKCEKSVLEDIRRNLLNREELKGKDIGIEIKKGRGQNSKMHFLEIVSENETTVEQVKNGIKGIIEGKKIIIKLEKNEQEYKANKEIGWYESNQIVSHLIKFKKVLYTNGLEFYWLRVNESNAKNDLSIEVQELGNLSSVYELYKKSSSQDAVLSEAHKKWKQLIDGLIRIDWHAEPKTLIIEEIDN